MKKFTRILALTLVLVMSLALLCGCDDNESIYGTWNEVAVDDTTETKGFLKDLGFYDEEIALIDLGTMKTVYMVKFNEDKTYERGVNIEATDALMVEFVEGMMEALYNGRASLAGLYGEEINELTRDEFNLFYAEQFGCETYQEMVDLLAYDSWEYENESGTYNAAMGSIFLTPEGETEAQSAGYKVSGDKLTVEYADGDAVYTKE